MCKKVWLVLFATCGPGLATVKYLLSREQKVIVLIDPQLGADLVGKNNPDLEVLLVDFSSEASIWKATRVILRRHDYIDMLVNMHTRSEGEIRRKIQSGEKAVLVMIRSMLGLLRKSEYNHLIDYSLNSGWRDTPTNKAANLSLEMLYHEAKQSGVKVTVV